MHAKSYYFANHSLYFNVLYVLFATFLMVQFIYAPPNYLIVL
jgi:hypothetical protein